jgi:hypothetical protein
MSFDRNQISDLCCVPQQIDSTNWPFALTVWKVLSGFTVKPDDHSEVVPLLPIPNRKVKRLSADDSADSRVKVGHCQATIREALVE